MTWRPSRGALAVVVAAVLLNLLTRATGDAWLALGSAAAGALLVASFVLKPRLAGLDIRIGGPDRVAVGEQTAQAFLVRNPTARPLPAVRLVDTCAGFEGFEVHVPPLAPGEQVRLPLVRRAVQRGAFHGPSIQVSSTAPFGVIRFTQAFNLAQQLVHPVPEDLPRVLDRAGAAGVGDPVGVAGVGTEVLGLRAWRPGDSARSLSARASARHGRPFVLEREQELAPGRRLVVLAVGGSTGPDWERAISHAAGRVLQAMEEGARVQLVVGGGMSHSPRILDRSAVLDFFARVDAAPAMTPDELQEAAASVHPGGSVLYLAGSRGEPLTGSCDGCCEQLVLRG
jgi:uncharacterized protein (DUF58 family)